MDKIDERIIDFSSVLSVCEATVHNFQGFVRETSYLAVRTTHTMQSKDLLKSFSSATHDPT